MLLTGANWSLGESGFFGSPLTLDLMAFLVLWLRVFDRRFDPGADAMIFVLCEWTEQFDYSSTAADINHVNAGHSLIPKALEQLLSLPVSLQV